MKNKIISLLIVFTLICSLVPGLNLEAHGAEEPTVQGEVYGNKTNEEKIAEAIEALRDYYLNSDKDFTFRVALAYHFISDNLERDLQIIQERFKVDNPDSASEYAKAIMGLIAAGKDPRDYNGQNFVKTLADSQKADGKFIIIAGDDYPTTIAFSILALDMSNADYDVEKAVEALLSYQGPDGGFDGGWGASVDDTAMCIMALGKHQDINGVKDAISKGKKYIEDNQEDNGGFVSWGEDSPFSASAAIQGLIAVDENPLSEKWTTGSGKTMLDALLAYMVDDHFEYESQWGIDIDSITEQAFCALADLYRGKSMFHEIMLNDTEPRVVKIQAPSSTTLKQNEKLKLMANVYNDYGEILLGHNLIWETSDKNVAQVNSDGLVTAISTGTVTITVKVEGYQDISDTINLTVEPEEFIVNRMDSSEIKNGSEAKLEFEIQENQGVTRTAILIVALYEKNANKMVNYAFASKQFEPGENTNLGAGFAVPDTGSYIIRCFVWDSFENQKIFLSNPIEIEVKQ